MLRPEDLFYGTDGKPDAPIVCIGEAWGSEEALAELAFVGQSGQLLRQMLREADIDPSRVLFTNLVPSQPKKNDFTQFLAPGHGTGTYRGLNPKLELLDGLRRLYIQITAVPRTLIIACGNYPLWALTSVASVNKGTEKPRFGDPTPDTPTGIARYHGSQLWLDPIPGVVYGTLTFPETPVLPLFHPAAILRDWSLRHTTVHDLRNRVPRSVPLAKWRDPQRYTWLAPPTPGEVHHILNYWRITAEAEGGLTISLDIETKHQSFITCIGLGVGNAPLAISIPFVKIGPDKSFSSFWSASEEAKILRELAETLHHPKIKILGQNLNYDCQFLWHTMRLKPKVAFDTLIAQNLLFPGTPKDLATLSAMYCEYHRYWKDDNREWSDTGTLEQHLRYNCEDVTRTLEIARAQIALLVQTGKHHHLAFEMERFELAREMNERGIKRDPKATLRAGALIVEEMEQLATQLRLYVPQSFLPETKAKTTVPWYRSDSQIKFVLYDLLQLPIQYSRLTGRPSSGKEALHTLATDYPRLRRLFNALLDYGSLDTIYSTFIRARLDYGSRMRCSFGNTSTYRWTSSKNAFGRGGNLQNIPVGEDE